MSSAANGSLGDGARVASSERTGRIDVHAHFLPEKYRSALVAAGHAKPSGMPGIPEWSVEKAVAQWIA